MPTDALDKLTALLAALELDIAIHCKERANLAVTVYQIQDAWAHTVPADKNMQNGREQKLTERMERMARMLAYGEGRSE